MRSPWWAWYATVFGGPESASSPLLHVRRYEFGGARSGLSRKGDGLTGAYGVSRIGRDFERTWPQAKLGSKVPVFGTEL